MHQPGGYTKNFYRRYAKRDDFSRKRRISFSFLPGGRLGFLIFTVWDWHWHPEVEFVYVQTGTVVFLIGSRRYVLEAGTGIFYQYRSHSPL